MRPVRAGATAPASASSRIACKRLGASPWDSSMMSTMLVDGGKSSGISGNESTTTEDILDILGYPRISWISDDIDDASGFSI